MIVRMEPKDWDMYTVLLYFDKSAPHAEDDAVKGYLAERRLAPKREFDTTIEEKEYGVMSFGGCYLGRKHVDALAEIQRGFVEREMLASKIPDIIRNGSDEGARARASELSDDALEAAAIDLVAEYHRESSFEISSDGFLSVVLNETDVQASFLKLTSS